MTREQSQTVPDTEVERGAGDWRARLAAALPTALAVSLVTLVLTIARMNQRDLTGVTPAPQTFWLVLQTFLIPTLILFLTLIAGGLFGVFRSWWAAGLTGVLGATLGVFIGSAIRVLASGSAALDGATWGYIAQELLGIDFPLLAFAGLTAALLGPWLWRRMESDGGVAPRVRRTARSAVGGGALLSPVAGWSRSDGFRTALVRSPSDAMLAGEMGAGAAAPATSAVPAAAADVERQWQDLVSLYRDYGWDTVEVTPAPGMPGSTLIGEQAVSIGDAVVLARHAASERGQELPALRARLAAEDRVVLDLEAPAVLDGRDVVVIDRTVLVGLTAGTNAHAVKQLRLHLADRGFRVVPLTIDADRHLTDVVSVLPEGVALVEAGALADTLPIPTISVPGRGSAAVTALDAVTLAVPASTADTIELLRSRGYEVVPVELGLTGAAMNSLVLRVA